MEFAIISESGFLSASNYKPTFKGLEVVMFDDFEAAKSLCGVIKNTAIIKHSEAVDLCNSGMCKDDIMSIAYDSKI